MAEELGIFGSVFFSQIILPFILVFTLVFAILEKSKVLGEGKKQINSIISLVIGLLLVGVEPARAVILDIVPVLAVVAVIILVFMILYGFVGGTEDRGVLNKPLQITVGIIAVIVIIITLLTSTGFLDKILEKVKLPGSSEIVQSSVMLIVIVVLLIVALVSGGKKGESK